MDQAVDLGWHSIAPLSLESSNTLHRPKSSILQLPRFASGYLSRQVPSGWASRGFFEVDT
jgi:hypothetical protein